MVIINVGISGSGKSSWSIEHLKSNPNYLRLNRDDVRLQLVGDLKDYYKRADVFKIENLITEIQLYSFAALLDAKRDVILDNTNLHWSYITPFINVCDNKNVEYQFNLFDISLKEAQNRVWRRDFMEKSLFYSQVVEDNSYREEVQYIEKQYNQYKKIKKDVLDGYKDKILIK